MDASEVPNSVIQGLRFALAPRDEVRIVAGDGERIRVGYRE
jgi:hypothetical protein